MLEFSQYPEYGNNEIREYTDYENSRYEEDKSYDYDGNIITASSFESENDREPKESVPQEEPQIVYGKSYNSWNVLESNRDSS